MTGIDKIVEQPKTDWERIDGMADDDIDYSDIPELDDTFWNSAKVVIPKDYCFGI